MMRWFLTAITWRLLARWQLLWVAIWLALAVFHVSAQAATQPIHASAQASTPQITARLLSSHDNVFPGQTLTLAVHLNIQPNWHTYWRNPGDSGTATSIQWQFSSPSQAGDILWPLPERHRMGPIVNYGYADAVTLPVPVTVGQQVQAGQKWQATAVVDWLVCREECIPQQVTLTLSLPVVSAGQSQGQPQPLIAQAMQQQPQQVDWPVKLTRHAGIVSLDVENTLTTQDRPVWFYPYGWGPIAQSADQRLEVTESGLRLTLKQGDAPLAVGAALTGVLVVGEGAHKTGYQLSPRLQETAAVDAESPAALSLPWALVLALLGGLVLNLMPCVFPVLSMKALSLVSHASLSRRQWILQGLVYTAGVVLSFVLLAGILVLLKASGQEIGWGFQFQSPYFVMAMAYVLFLVGLNLSGVFTLGGSLAGVGQSLTTAPGYAGSFFTGVLATVVATPCTAPFMAAALGYALTQPAPALFAIFISLGFGLAAPYLLVTAWPAVHRFLPKPGVWMLYLKQLLAFPMYGAAIWLVWVLAQQAGASAVMLVLAGMLALAFAVWLYALSRTASRGRRWLANAVVASAGLLSLALASQLPSAEVGADNPQAALASPQTPSAPSKHWQPYSAQTFEQLRAEGKAVFVNATAAWCISCLVNEQVALSQPAVIQAFKQQQIAYLKADWTHKDPEITQLLRRFDRSGVPLYVFYPAGAGTAPVILPQILTTERVLSVLSLSSTL